LLCDRVMVMKAVKIVEQGPTERVLFAPQAHQRGRSAIQTY
jgi:ABC-type microcin C transport system duplicated ATPase subunit YejF